MDHRKHRHALALVEVSASRNRRRAGTVRLIVPTSVRVEAGWDRRLVTSAATNRLRIVDSPLDRDGAEQAASIVRALGVSVPDAHLATVLTTTPGPHAVLTSDAADVQRVAEYADIDVTVVPI